MFDSVLLASYGGPKNPNEIEPFLDRVLSGKRVPTARRDAIVKRYERFGGVSPLPDECRRFVQLLNELAPNEGASRPRVYWGALYSSPTFDDAAELMERDGVERLLVFPSSAFGSPQSCGRYRIAVESALRRRSADFFKSLVVSYVPPFFDLPALRRETADSILTALAWDELEGDFFAEKKEETRLILFSAHSIPTIDAEASSYRRQLLATANGVLRLILDAPSFGVKSEERGETQSWFSAAEDEFDVDDAIRARLRERALDAGLAFQSRSGSPATPWLEPSVEEYLARYCQENPQTKRVLVVPIGFFFENMETVYDLDVDLRATCDRLGVKYRRARCVGVSARMARAVWDLAKKEPETFPKCDCAPGFCDLSCRCVH